MLQRHLILISLRMMQSSLGRSVNLHNVHSDLPRFEN